MRPEIVALVALAGYLVGSISGARLAIRIAAPGADLDAARRHRGDRGESGTVTGIGAGTASIVLGRRAGIVVGVFDILKAFVPCLLLTLALPGQRAELVFGLAVVTGHIYPVFHGFKGGRGLSPMVGSLLVIEPLGMTVAILAGTLLGFLIDQPQTALALWFVFLAPWPWAVRGDLAASLYAVGLLVLFLLACIPDIRLLLQYRRQGRSAEYARMIQASTPQMRLFRRLATRIRFWDRDGDGAAESDR